MEFQTMTLSHEQIINLLNDKYNMNISKTSNNINYSQFKNSVAPYEILGINLNQSIENIKLDCYSQLKSISDIDNTFEIELKSLAVAVVMSNINNQLSIPISTLQTSKVKMPLNFQPVFIDSKALTKDIHAYCVCGDDNHILACLKNSTDINALVNSKSSKFSNNTPLILACKHGRVNAARILLCNGADIDATGNDGKTALHHAFTNRKSNITGLLMSYGASKLIHDDFGYLYNDEIYSFGTELLVKNEQKNMDENPVIPSVDYLY